MGRGNMLLGTRCPKSICTNIPGAHSVKKKKKKKGGERAGETSLSTLYLYLESHTALQNSDGRSRASRRTETWPHHSLVNRSTFRHC